MLHEVLGQVLCAIDEGRLEGQYGEGLMADAVRFAQSATKSLAQDPLRFGTAALVVGVLTALGFPGAGAFLAAVTLDLKRK